MVACFKNGVNHMRNLNVMIPLMYGDLNPANGSGIKKYKYMLCRGIKNSAGVDLTTTVSKKIGPIGNPLSFMLGNLFKNISGFDIVHNLEQGFPFLTSRKGNTKLITTIHDLGIILYPALFSSGFKDDLYEYVENKSVETAFNSDLIIANSTQTKNEVVSQGYKGKVRVIPLGVDEKFKVPIKKTQRHAFTVGIVGGLAKRKNVINGIDAFSKTDQNDMRLEIWGRGPTKEERMLQNKAKLDDRIKFKGFIPENQIVKTLDRFDIILVPTLYEGFGLSILEAQSRGLPVVIYKNAIIPQEVRKYCIEAKDNEHIADIIETIKQTGAEDQQKATKYARSFSWNTTIKETLSVYKAITQ